MAKVTPEESVRISDPNDFNSQVREYVTLKESMDMLEKRATELREKLFEKIELEGEVDDKGNVFLELPAEVKGIVRLEKQRRVSRKLDELAADEIIMEHHLAGELYKTIQVVDEDAVMAAHYEGKLSEDEIEKMFPAKVVWALRTAKK
jgi:glycine/D-amino acid oxidase-like deaminating enzyme